MGIDDTSISGGLTRSDRWGRKLRFRGTDPRAGERCQASHSVILEDRMK